MEMVYFMKDDITSREVELIKAVLVALKVNEDIFILKSIDSDVDQRLKDFQEGFTTGYQDALKVICGVLQDRGFDVVWVEERIGENHDPD